MNNMGKKVSDSLTEQIQIVLSGYINGQKRLFGGKIMEWIDVVAGVVARRHSGYDVTTAAVDNLQFKAPAKLNSTVILIGKITYVGNTSMEVKVTTYVEELNGERKLINVAYLVLVAIDDNNKPVKVPPLILETSEEKQEWEAGKKRNELRKQRRKENF